jgi:hypothetical protein
MTGEKGRPGTASLTSKVCSGMTFAYRDNLTRRRFFGGIEIVRAVLSVCSQMKKKKNFEYCFAVLFKNKLFTVSLL